MGIGCSYIMSVIGITMAVLIKQWFASQPPCGTPLLSV